MEDKIRFKHFIYEISEFNPLVAVDGYDGEIFILVGCKGNNAICKPLESDDEKLFPIESIKPYLRDMNNMREDEELEIEEMVKTSDEEFFAAFQEILKISLETDNPDYIDKSVVSSYYQIPEVIYFCQHFLDYGRFIKSGLALEAGDLYERTNYNANL